MTFFSDTYYMFIRWMKKLARNPILLFFSLFQPIIFLVLFTQLFKSFGTFLRVDYVVFATSGIVLQNAFSSAFQSGTAVVDDIRSGFLTKMLATPASRASILMGRILSDAFRVIIQSIIILVLAYGLGVFPQTGVLGYPAILFTVAFFGLAWSGISLALGLRTKSAETVFGIAGFLTFPLLFMSTALVPRDGMGVDWMKHVSDFNPISITVDAIRVLIGPTTFDVSKIFIDYGVISLIALITLGATLYEFRKLVS
jgi:ABC-2 type transport system permease protein